ncbi:MAG: (deoxy)nucleoside triphosphate pyrophosphohydrolase [Bacteroidetes bacterium]|nr:(deoxy)nucleoside triphosphate pyrophosphohydrolase [Bacteroidota bacterium]
MKKVEVVAAIIIHQEKILCVQRNESTLSYISKKYEFPGGKIEVGETKEQTIIREIKEELEMDIKISHELMTVVHQYPDFELTMHSFICSCINNEVTLTEHLDFRWLDKSQLLNLDWAAADIPIVHKLIEN